MTEPVLSIVLVNYNVEHFLELCLHSVLAAVKDIPTEIFVVDNHSSDGSMDMLRKKFGQVHLIGNTENVGFSRANNQAIRLAKGKYILLLNPDTVIPEDCLSKCLNFMEQTPDAGGLGARMLDGAGIYLPESKRGLPTPWVSFCKAFGLARLFPTNPMFGKYHLSYLNEMETHEVDVLSGAFMLMRKSALDVSGLLDESFFMYGEDVDLSYRIQMAGFKNYYFPETTILHFKGESTKRGSISFVRHFYKAMLLFSKKHFSNRFAFTLFIYFGIAVRAVLALVKRFIDYSGAFLIEFLIAFAGMAFIKNWWELNFKGIPGMYPDFFMQLLIPTYLLVWIGSTRIVGRFSEQFGHGAIIKGIALGTILISGVTNFFDDYRFSKGLILIGAVWTYLVVTIRFMGVQWFQNKNLLFSTNKKKRVLMAGSASDVENARSILRKFDQELAVCGWVSPDPDSQTSQANYLGVMKSLPALSYRLGLEEVLFCLGDLRSTEIIHWIQTMRNSGIRFSFLAPNGHFIVSSSEKHARGKVYQSENIPDLVRPYNLRLKRLSDFAICIVLLAFMPFVLMFMKRPVTFLTNWKNVILGKMSWIGLKLNRYRTHGLRDGIISMENLAGPQAEQSLVESLDSLYLNEFHPEHEFWTVLKNIRKLDQATRTME
ncbi:MAG TPA: glycosyltransferase [Catalimonadaceae bacterium]|nr:glycosyltransferase [Catalimonadaceae bacterium]